MSGITTLTIVGALMACTLGGVTLLAYVYNLNNIKSKTVGDGQHGTARWANRGEVKKTYAQIPYTPQKWREQNRGIPKASVFNVRRGSNRGRYYFPRRDDRRYLR